MSIIEQHLSVNVSHDELFAKLKISTNQCNMLQNYQLLCKNSYENLKDIEEKLKIIIINFIDEQFELINQNDVDLNYYIKHINIFFNTKFNLQLEKLNIEHNVSFIDYTNNKHKHYKFLSEEYIKYAFNKIINNTYKPVNTSVPTELIKLLDENWLKINFANIIEFTHSISKIGFLKQDISIFVDIFKNKFDDLNNIIKFVEHIVNTNTTESDNDNDDTLPSHQSLNYRFIIDNLKSNGFLLFEEYFKQLKIRYKDIKNISQIKKEKKIINYFIYIIKQKPVDNVNRYVNEILTKMRDMIEDIDNSYHNTIAYRKIIVNVESDKYKKIHLYSYDRNNTYFKILKYNFCDDKLILNYKLPSKIEPYIAMYKAYYKSRYPDRIIEIDLINSTLVISLNMNKKMYYIQLALIQFIVLDKLYNSNKEISCSELSAMIDIPSNKLFLTLSSLLKVKLIGRLSTTNDTNFTEDSLDNIKFIFNQNFDRENDKISISSLVLSKNSNLEAKTKELAHDRTTIVLCNLLDYVKKNKYLVADTMIEELEYKIPFKLNEQYINNAITHSINKGYIRAIEIPNTNGVNQIMYEYIE